MITEVADLGGLIDIFYIAICLLIWYFGTPFKDLDLAISFNKLMTKINKKHNMQFKSEELTTAYEKHIGICFFMQHFAYKRLPPFLHSCLGLKEDKSSKMARRETMKTGQIDTHPSFWAMADHFDELHQQVKYELSLRN